MEKKAGKETLPYRLRRTSLWNYLPQKKGGKEKKNPLFPCTKVHCPQITKKRTFMEAFLEKTVERTYIFKSHTIWLGGEDESPFTSHF